MIQKRIQKELQEIAKQYDKPYHVIEEIYLSQFRLTAEKMRSLEFCSIKLPSWGKYIASNNKVKNFKETLLNNYINYGAYSNKDTPIQGQE